MEKVSPTIKSSYKIILSKQIKETFQIFNTKTPLKLLANQLATAIKVRNYSHRNSSHIIRTSNELHFCWQLGIVKHFM